MRPSTEEVKCVMEVCGALKGVSVVQVVMAGGSSDSSTAASLKPFHGRSCSRETVLRIRVDISVVSEGKVSDDRAKRFRIRSCGVAGTHHPVTQPPTRPTRTLATGAVSV
ncbi:hypothetical protein E2C01_054642 [Portunus trituberculatus]|uniref:Uncharacterized protein n=1 Tax=Portunus trituberculatus TaxID=210409 RepID=A0A5B7GK64_PORTR|nr:hypothetical protein [Portunus trituberculatus]